MKSLLKKISNMPENLKATLVFAVASFATSGINYITTPIFTRLLSPAEYGIVSLYNSWFDIIKVFASLTLIFPGILNVGLFHHKDNRWKYLSSMLGITTATTLLLSVIYAIFYKQINVLLDLSTPLMILMLSMCFLQPATIFWTFKQRYEINYRITFWVSVGSAVAAQIVSVAAVAILKNYTTLNLAVVRLWSAGLVNLLVALVIFILICKRGAKFIDFPLWKMTIAVALPLIPHYLSSVILSSTDKIMISSMVGKDKTGIYSLVAILSAIGVLVWRALSVTFTPFVNEKLATREFHDIRKSVKPLLFVVGIFCIITSLAAPEIIRILAKKEYLEGIYVVPPIAAGIYIHALYDNFTAVSFFHKKSFNIMLATSIAAVLNIVMNYFCIKKFGYIAAGYTTLASNLILTGMHYLNARLIEREKVYDPVFSFVSVSVVTVCCLLCNLLYINNSAIMIIIRYALVLVLLAILVIKRKNVIDAIVSMKIDDKNGVKNK